MNAHPATLRRELSAAQRIPYAAHVSPHIVKTAFGDYVQVLRIGGASFECADDETLNTWHERLNVLWRNIASPQVALWTHVIRRREVTSVGEGGSSFANVLEAKYRERLAHQTLMVNELYLSTVYRPTAGVATSLVAKLMSRAGAESRRLNLRTPWTPARSFARPFVPRSRGMSRKRSASIRAMGANTQSR